MKNPSLKQHLLAQPTRTKKVYVYACLCVAGTLMCIRSSVPARACAQKCVNECVFTYMHPEYTVCENVLVKCAGKFRAEEDLLLLGPNLQNQPEFTFS